MEAIKRSELSNTRMVAKNEQKYATVIDKGIVKDWVGIGWIDIREADESDYNSIPVVED